ncbi:MAG: hypothetical protein KKF54_06715, partial [Candidatus Omnitrophica bacterium]|nr:hypothetical protein [Candidatus Omnitrophota bacterium]
KSLEGELESGWSQPKKVEVNFPPAIPTGISLPTLDTDGVFEVRWVESVDATGYKLEIAKDEAFTKMVKSEETTELTYDVILSEEGEYWVRVKSLEGDLLESEWSNPRSIKIEFADEPVDPGKEEDPNLPITGGDGEKGGCFISGIELWKNKY